MLLPAGGVFTDTTNATDINHDISVVGYGEEKGGEKYWIIRNSWGTYWGENGFFRLARGTNNLGIEVEGTCSWAAPKDTWSDIVFPKKEYKVCTWTSSPCQGRQRDSLTRLDWPKSGTIG